MRASVKELVRACRRLSSLGNKLTVEEWEKAWNRFAALRDKHFAAGEGLLDLEPLSMLKPGING